MLNACISFARDSLCAAVNRIWGGGYIISLNYLKGTALWNKL
jgi:hypothetical protein